MLQLDQVLHDPALATDLALMRQGHQRQQQALSNRDGRLQTGLKLEDGHASLLAALSKAVGPENAELLLLQPAQPGMLLQPAGPSHHQPSLLGTMQELGRQQQQRQLLLLQGQHTEVRSKEQ